MDPELRVLMAGWMRADAQDSEVGARERGERGLATNHADDRRFALVMPLHVTSIGLSYPTFVVYHPRSIVYFESNPAVGRRAGILVSIGARGAMRRRAMRAL